MDKKIVGLVGAVAGLATIGTAQAAIAPAPPASYADLLASVPNPIQALQADNAARAKPNRVELAQWYYGPYYGYGYYHHHHHHHHRR